MTARDAVTLVGLSLIGVALALFVVGALLEMFDRRGAGLFVMAQAFACVGGGICAVEFITETH